MKLGQLNISISALLRAFRDRISGLNTGIVYIDELNRSPADHYRWRR